MPLLNNKPEATEGDERPLPLPENILSVSTGKNKLTASIEKNVRLSSLDFYRGLIMVLLMFESTGLYRYILKMSEPGSLINSIAFQFTHHKWHGLHLWDLIQPAFMFIAGTAMAFSLTRQTAKGSPWWKQARHALRRSWWLFFWGVLDYAVNVKAGTLSFQLWDVLTQMSFTMLLAFLIFKWKVRYQIVFSIGLLILTECLYRFINVPGFDQPFTDQHNFGNYMDLVLMNTINAKGWVAINCIPTAAHTIWGAIAGKWLLTLPDNKSRIKHLIVFGLLALLAGYGLDLAGITPIIKRIATTSFTLVSGGWCILILAFLYYWIDVLGHKRFLKFFTIVGMNSIFIYLFFEFVVKHWIRDYMNTIVINVVTPTGLSLDWVMIVAALSIFVVEWYACYWLYRKKIFFKV
jgi:predicted acyltransferase